MKFSWPAPQTLIQSLNMRRRRHTAEEIIKRLREAATLLAEGESVEEICKKVEVSPLTYHRWRQEYDGAKEETVKRLKELEKENGRLKKLVADLSLDKAILKEIAEGAERSETACAKGSAGGRWQYGRPGAQRRSA